MSLVKMPDGEYFSLSGMVRAHYGGQTRALLMRNRFFAEHAGLTPTILTIDSEPVYPAVRAELREMGLLHEKVSLINFYEYFREDDLSDLEVLDPTITPAIGGGLTRPNAAADQTTDQLDADGHLYRTVHSDPVTEDVRYTDYFRLDGTRYLRVSTAKGSAAAADRCLLLNEQEQVVQRVTKVGGLYRFWFRRLVPAKGRVLLISDSRHALAHFLPFSSKRVHVMHLMHNTHTVGERHWNSRLSDLYAPLLTNLTVLDGLVTLTHRQRDDVAARYGRTSNLFVVSNPVVIPPRPDPLPERAAKRFVVVARLEAQKRLSHAVDIFARVLETAPDVTLDIYGDGSLRASLQNQIDDLGVGHAVRLLGHDPAARQQLWTATAFLMTSGFEGYPLATLESLSHGCPVISYDIKYGPREQVSDGVDGFIIPAGDKDAFAAAILRLVADPDLARSMSTAAYAKAEQHDYRVFLEDWREVITSVIAQKKHRVKVTAVTLEVDQLDFLPGLSARVPVRVAVSPSSFRRPRTLDLRARLTVVEGGGDEADPTEATVLLEAVAEGSERLVGVPVQVSLVEGQYHLSASVPVTDLFHDGQTSPQTVELRVTFVWQNYAWSTMVTRPVPSGPTYETDFGPTGVLQVRAFGSSE